MLGSISGLAPTADNSGLALGTGTGPHGVIAQSQGNTAVSAIDSVLNWLKAPLTEQWSPQEIFLIVGIIIASFIGWNMILYHIRLAAETL